MPNRADEIFSETEKLPQAAKDAIWKKLEAERGSNGAFSFDDPNDGVRALALLRPKVLESPETWTNDDWKLVFCFLFEGCVEQNRAVEDVCWVYARIVADLPKLSDGGRNFLIDMEKVGEVVAKPLRGELERPDFALRVGAYELLRKLDPSADPKLSGVSNEARALFERVDELVEDDKTWHGKTVELLRTHPIETIRDALLKARERPNDFGKYYTPIALGLAIARLELEAKKPLSPEAEGALLADLDCYLDDELETTRGLLAALDERKREELLLRALDGAKNGNERKRCMQLAHMCKATLPKVLAVIDALQIGKYDAYKKTDAIRNLVAFGPSIAKTLADDAASRSAVAAEVIATALGDFADPATATALVELLGHAAKPVRLAATASLKRMGAAARDAIDAGAKSKKKAIRAGCAELAQAATPEPSAAAGLSPEDEGSIIAALDAAKKSDYGALESAGRAHGAAAIAVGHEWLRTNGAGDWYSRNAFVRLLPPAMEKDAQGAVAAFVRAFAELPKLDSYAVRDLKRAMLDGKEHAVKPLVAALKGPAFPLRTLAFEALVEINPKADRELFVSALADTSKEVRTLAAQCIEQLGGDPSDVAAHLASKNAEARAAAAALLAKIANESVRGAIEKALAAEKKPEIAALLEKALVASGGSAPTDHSGDDTEQSIVALLEGEKLAKMPKFLDFEKMPKLRLRSGRALEGKAMTGLVTRLMNEGPDQEDSVARRVRPFLDDASANEVSNALREAWANDKRDSKHKWAVYQQGILASDERLNFAGPKLDELVSGGQHHLAGWYADVLYRHSMRGESTTGLSWLAHWSRAADTRSLKTRARALLEQAAEQKKLTVAQLEGTLNAYVADDVADASIPTLGFDSGQVEIEKFTVRLGSDLKLQHDKKVPAEAKERLTRLKKQVSSLFSSEKARFEQAMISGRPWSAAAFRKLFIEHPLMKSIGERLVFSATQGKERALFRVAEGTCVAADYANVPLMNDTVVRIVHPLEMTQAELAAWGTHFTEAETLPPFPQLGRTTFARSEELLPKGKVNPGALAGRVRGLGWRNAAAEDAGMVYEATKTFAGRGVRASLSHEGYHVADNSWTTDPVGLSGISFSDLLGKEIEQGAVDPIVFSEVAGDLQRMVDA